MRKTSLIAAVAALSFAFGTAVQAQDTERGTSSSDLLQVVVRDDPRPVLAERLVRLTLNGMEKFTQETITRDLIEAGDALPEEQARWLRRNASSIIDSNLRPLIGAIAQEYATRFTEAELNALIAFYDGPVGRDIARKQMELGGALGEAMQKFQIAFVTELSTKFCAEFDCAAFAAKETPTAKPNRR